MTDNSENQFEMIKRLELDKLAHLELIKHAEKTNKVLIYTFDRESVDFLDELNIPFFKIPSEK